MKAAVLISPAPQPGPFLRIEDVPRPRCVPRHVLLRVLACGVCRTELHLS